MARPTWDPLRDLLSLQERMNRLFEESLARGLEPAALPAAWSPAADVLESEAAYVVEIELAGLQRDDVALQVDPHQLVVRGERRATFDPRPERFHRLERSYGAFQRVFSFDDEIALARVSADLQDGVLRVELPKARSRVRRQIPVERG